MFNLGIQEIMLLLFIALIALGPKRLPGAARSLGRFVRQAKTIVQSITGLWDQEILDIKEDLSNRHEPADTAPKTTQNDSPPTPPE